MARHLHLCHLAASLIQSDLYLSHFEGKALAQMPSSDRLVVLGFEFTIL